MTISTRSPFIAAPGYQAAKATADLAHTFLLPQGHPPQISGSALAAAEGRRGPARGGKAGAGSRREGRGRLAEGRQGPARGGERGSGSRREGRGRPAEGRQGPARGGKAGAGSRREGRGRLARPLPAR